MNGAKRTGLHVLRFPKFMNRNADDLMGALFCRRGPYDIVNCWDWRSVRCLDEIIGNLRDEFEPKDPIGEENEAMLLRIESEENAVSVHVRRGDKTLRGNPNLYAILSADYYKGAERAVAERVPNPVFFCVLRRHWLGQGEFEIRPPMRFR
ncbi:MAG: hypothetical protein LBI39_04050 [Puniceicoccales bacterium]|nr:hypothetical protein [Puniceicoccales bacterium]